MFLRVIVLAFSYIGAVSAEDCCSVSGQLSTQFKYLNGSADDGLSQQHYLDAVYALPNNSARGYLGMGFMDQNRKTEIQFKQAYFEKKSTIGEIRFGRLPVSDVLGFYSLDGLQYKRVLPHQSFEAKLGVPRKIEDFNSINVDQLLTLAWQYFLPGSSANESVGLQSLYRSTARFDLLHLRDSESKDKQSILGFTFIGRHNISPDLSRSNAHFSGNINIDSGELYKAKAQVDFPCCRRGGLFRLQLSAFKPQKEILDFNQRFYQYYATGHQVHFEPSLYRRLKNRRSTRFAIRYVDRENSNAGFGANMSLSTRYVDGLREELRLDVLHLNNDTIATAYARRSSAVNALLRYRLGVALQKSVDGHDENTILSAEYKVDYMPGSQTLVSMYMSSGFDRQKDNDYKLRIKVEWYFDKATRSVF